VCACRRYHTSGFVDITKGVPQGLVLGLPFYLFYTLTVLFLKKAFHLYVDDIMGYCSESTPDQALSELQLAFITI